MHLPFVNQSLHKSSNAPTTCIGRSPLEAPAFSSPSNQLTIVSLSELGVSEGFGSFLFLNSTQRIYFDCLIHFILIWLKPSYKVQNTAPINAKKKARC